MRLQNLIQDTRLLRGKCMDIVKNAPHLPSEIKQYCVFEEKDGQKIYLDAYIPFIGEKYGQATKILFLGTAQCLSDHNKKYRMEYINDPNFALERLRIREPGTLNIDVGPVASGIVPALAGVVLFLKNGIWEEDLARILDYMTVTNFYKFSLWDSKRRDLHPEMLEVQLREKYTSFMFHNYIKPEINTLKPDYIFVFGSRPYQIISQYLGTENIMAKVFQLNDTAWLLRSPKHLEEWAKSQSPLENKIEKLIDIYCGYIKEKAVYRQFRTRIKPIRIYLKHYCSLLTE